MGGETSGLLGRAEAAGRALGRAALRVAFPPQCLSCGALVAEDGGLCASCWPAAGFLDGLVCDACGAALPGRSDCAEHCDDCLARPRPWARGRAVLSYRGAGRSLALALKHGDRLDLAPTLSAWMARAAAPLLLPGMLVVPVPLHWRRLFRRRFNQSAVLAAGVAVNARLDLCPDLLLRGRATASQDGRSPGERFANLEGAIRLDPRRTPLLRGRPVLLVDDVMTSGATFAASTVALQAGGAGPVHVLALARVAKDA